MKSFNQLVESKRADMLATQVSRLNGLDASAIDKLAEIVATRGNVFGSANTLKAAIDAALGIGKLNASQAAFDSLAARMAALS